MDGRRFDALVRSLAAGRSRRSMVKGFLGLGSMAIAGRALEVEAARRPMPTPKPRSCPGVQVPCGNDCCCPDGSDKCGPDCCPPEAECCDNACCSGVCYGEELCCPTGSLVCDGVCTDWACCTDEDCASGVCDPNTHQCECVPSCPAGYCGDDGCGNTCQCAEGLLCLSNGRCGIQCGAEPFPRFCAGDCGCVGSWDGGSNIEGICTEDPPVVGGPCDLDSQDCPPGYVCTGFQCAKLCLS